MTLILSKSFTQTLEFMESILKQDMLTLALMEVVCSQFAPTKQTSYVKYDFFINNSKKKKKYSGSKNYLQIIKVKKIIGTYLYVKKSFIICFQFCFTYFRAILLNYIKLKKLCYEQFGAGRLKLRHRYSERSSGKKIYYRYLLLWHEQNSYNRFQQHLHQRSIIMDENNLVLDEHFFY